MIPLLATIGAVIVALILGYGLHRVLTTISFRDPKDKPTEKE